MASVELSTDAGKEATAVGGAIVGEHRPGR